MKYCNCCKQSYEFTTIFDQIIWNEYYFNRAIYNKLGNNRVYCPNCSSLPRHRAIYAYLDEHKEQLKGKKILYFAAEGTSINWFIDNQIYAVMCDPTYTEKPWWLAEDFWTNEYIQVACSTMENIKNCFPPNYFDLIVALDVLEHTSDLNNSIKNMHDLLVDGGSFVATFPIKWDCHYPLFIEPTVTDEDRWNMYGQIDHNLLFGSEYLQMFSRNGWDLTKYSKYSQEHIQKLYPEKDLALDYGPSDFDYPYLHVFTK